MKIVKPQVIVPDTSQWGNWVKAATNPSNPNYKAATSLYEKLVPAGRIPLLSWHHLEELLAIEDETIAYQRIAFIKKLPHISYVKFPVDDQLPGSIVDILSAEVQAVIDGASTLTEVRDGAKKLMLHHGAGSHALGVDTEVWDVLREKFLERNKDAKKVAAIRRMNLFDDKRTVGEIAEGAIRSADGQIAMKKNIYAKVLSHVKDRGDPKITDASTMALEFVNEVQAISIPEDVTVRSLLQMTLESQGVEREEIHDNALLSDLNDLALFRARLSVVADNTGLSYNELKSIDMKILPSWQTQHSLERLGQDRIRRPGSDVADHHLSTLAPYVDELFVDKRTAEDFRRVITKNEAIVPLLAQVKRAKNFHCLASGSV